MALHSGTKTSRHSDMSDPSQDTRDQDFRASLFGAAYTILCLSIKHQSRRRWNPWSSLLFSIKPQHALSSLKFTKKHSTTQNMAPLHRATSLITRLPRSAHRPSINPSLASTPRRTLCMPPGPTLRYSVEPAPPAQEEEDVFEPMTNTKACPSDSDGITPEAALAELRRLTPELAQLGIHHPTPVAPFTDVDPITGEMAPKKRASFFSRA